ncbi:MAG: sulfotransferase domain-containing protein [Pseudomonadota bacterium]
MTIVPSELPTESYPGKISDPTRWGAYEPRPGDIIVNTPPKSGTTWVQSILAMLIAADPGVDAELTMKCPWIDINVRPIDELCARLSEQKHQRQVKSHTPFDGLPWWDELRYIAVYRHPIDVHFSFRRHVENFQLSMMAPFYPAGPRESFRLFLEGQQVDEVSLWLIAQHLRATRAREGRENLLVLHYADMGRDLRGTVASIAAHVGIEASERLIDAVAEAATFDNMRANAGRFAPSAWQGDADKDRGFFDSGSSNKWEGVLTDDDLAAYHARLAELLGPEDRLWLEQGAG